VKPCARSKDRALSKITKKFEELPAAHPDKPTLAKMIVALRAEASRNELAPLKIYYQTSRSR